MVISDAFKVFQGIKEMGKGLVIIAQVPVNKPEVIQCAAPSFQVVDLIADGQGSLVIINGAVIQAADVECDTNARISVG